MRVTFSAVQSAIDLHRRLLWALVFTELVISNRLVPAVTTYIADLMSVVIHAILCNPLIAQTVDLSAPEVPKLSPHNNMMYVQQVSTNNGQPSTCSADTF